MNTKQFKQALRNGPYAWPGGYPLFFVMSDGEALSFNAAKSEAKQIIRAIREHDIRGGWYPEGVTINWEDSTLYCCHTGEQIECAYHEDETS